MLMEGFLTNNFGLWAAVYPFLFRILYKIRQSVDPLYMHGTCMMDLVRLSAPEVYKAHPFWPHYQRNLTDAESCESLFGGSMEDFNLKMFSDGILEQKIFQLMLAICAILAAYQLAKRIWTGTIGSLRTVIVFIFTSYIHASFFLLMSHYQNDLTHLNGNVGHHSEFKVIALVDSLPHGLVFNFSLNYATSM